MELSYQKNDNSLLFSSLVKNNDLIEPQNYIPIYSNFFALSPSNYNSINLKQSYSLNNIIQKYDENTFQCKVKDNYGNTHTKDVFFKYSPLIDPVKYMIGKYDNSNNTLFELPSFNNTISHAKLRDTNNSAYIDSFFSYLTSKTLHTHGFLNGLDFYGSFLSVKNNFIVNVCDDIDYLSDSSFFKKNIGHLFSINYDFNSRGNLSDTRNFKEPIKIIDETPKNCIQLSDIHDLDELDKLLADADANDSKEHDSTIATIYEMDNTMKNEEVSQNTSCVNESDSCEADSDSSEADSNESDTESESDNKNKDDSDSDSDYSPSASETETETETDASAETDVETDKDSVSETKKDKDKDKDKDKEEDSEDEEDSDDDDIIATINKFPVQAIALEKCENTLDSLIIDDELTDDEWGSIVIQVLMCLITYQKMFQFTHNDLHSNNIMFVKTEMKHLYYHVNKKYYKVPTFGRIFKIIDFGRAIYTFRKTILCSDSFSRHGDASSQYNCEPFFNQKKPRLDPNPSFDLCRLGCSIFDMIVEDLKDVDKITSPILKIIISWCMDDKSRNVMYKSNGEERYPDFKLYKMIARTVHNHVPNKVLQNTYFDAYVVEKKKIKSNTNMIMDIDSYPCYS